MLGTQIDFSLFGKFLCTVYCTLLTIEEGFIQKTRQTVVVSVWGARSCAALGNFGLNVQYCVQSCCTLPFTFVGGVGRGDFLLRFVF